MVLAHSSEPQYVERHQFEASLQTCLFTEYMLFFSESRVSSGCDVHQDGRMHCSAGLQGPNA